MENQSTPKIFKKNILVFLSYWKLMLILVLFFVSIAFFYIRYSTRIYSASVTILVNDPTSGGSNTELSAFSDKFSIYNQNKINLSNELNILSSSEIVYNTIKDLKLNITYFSDGNIKSEELYHVSPITLQPIKPTVFENEYYGFIIKQIGNNFFELYDADDELIGKYQFNRIITHKTISFKIIKKNSNYNFDRIYINIVPINSLVSSYKFRTLNQKIEETTIVNITFSDSKTDRAKEYLDCLVKNYELVSIKDKKKQLSKTHDFVLSRIDEIESKLGGVELKQTRFRENTNTASLSVETNLELSKSEELITKITENLIQLDHIKGLNQILINSELDYIPSNIINISPILQSQIFKYNDQLTERNNLIKGSKETLPTIVRMDSKLKSLKGNIIQGIDGSIKLLESQNSSLKSRLNNIQNQLGDVPSKDDQIGKSERSKNILSDMYRYLLNKKEETSILLYSISSNIKVLEPASSNYNPIYPSKKIIYFGAILLALFVSILYILIKEVFDTRLKNKNGLVNKNNNFLFIGEIVRNIDGNIIRNINDRSVLSESLRIVRSNIDFILKSNKKLKDNVAKKIFVSSTVPKEGKTFISVNLALSYSQLNKKVLLLGFDIRNPKLSSLIQNINANTGITNYLVSDDDSIKKYIQKSELGIDIISSGVVPPNPTELLTSSKINSIFEQLEKEYDYIIVDTAPIAIVSDTLLLAEYSDLFVYIFRHNYSDVRLITDLNENIEMGKLKNVATILNDVAFKSGYGYYGDGSYGYGKKYGYSYGNSENVKQNFLVKIINKLKFWK
jgi:tyrosine-protein kinase Etk/Wzc